MVNPNALPIQFDESYFGHRHKEVQTDASLMELGEAWNFLASQTGNTNLNGEEWTMSEASKELLKSLKRDENAS